MHVERGVVVKSALMPTRSIALDGYCQGPSIDTVGERFSFDHHDECVRHVTRATCGQVLDALLLGFDPSWYTAYVNDVDGDTALSVWLLENPSRVREPRVRALVEVVSAIDAHGPAYPAADPQLADAFFAGAMAPEIAARRNRTYATADLNALLRACVERITALIDGTLTLESKKKERSFEITHRGTGWVMARSQDFVFDLLYAAGHTRAIAYQKQSDETIAYTVGKQSEFVSRFPVGPPSMAGTILHTLREREVGWGGGSTIGGAPRNPNGSRSRLTADAVFAIVESIVAAL